MNAPLKASSNIQLQVTPVDLNDAKTARRIEDFVKEQGASLFHRPQWLRAVEAGTGQRAAGFLAETNGVIVGWLPITEAKSALFGKAFISSGFGVGGGICATDHRAINILAHTAETFAEANSFTTIELRGGTIPATWQSWDDKHCGFERPLAADDEAELLAIPRKARAEVRKGLKNDLEIRIGTGRDDLAAHFAMFSESVRNLGTPVFPRSLFAAMIEAFPDTSDILTVVKDGKPIASVLSFYHDVAVMPFWGGGTMAARDARANERMYYELMRHGRSRGMERFDFGRSKTGSGPYNFKKNWGFEPAPLTYSAWHAPGHAPRNIDPTDAAYSGKIGLWKKLPLPIANTIGPWIARGLA
ncbi:FemAB family XrtA/PEP-CTERM system-associated protein [Erythrobacter sp. YT30]|uniref:FemAB family XrtA/PEP-CTERM system-associated protein n=1 Tax=Erythrobacter sp. YT30 TaxID=1735012 RepID=UPI00076D2521|nr:FemAB family XrtA/PEP-CTERM system-associated protein [Erythrobacter sp. YT30]KWV93075.1 FemAB [Erythrobacter sp. YT30]